MEVASKILECLQLPDVKESDIRLYDLLFK